MIVFASVFIEFLVLPVGSIFGGRNSPSFFCLLSKVCSHVASNTICWPNDDLENLTQLACRVRLVPDLTDSQGPLSACACHS